MIVAETNIFPIANLSELSTRYRTYRIRGLSRDSQDYYKNRDRIVGRLSFQMKAPVEIFEEGGEHLLAVPEDAAALPTSLMMVRTSVRLDPMPDIRILDYSKRSPETDRICTRFINTMLWRPLWNTIGLWQPRSGGGFYEKSPLSVVHGIGRHEGFTVRAMITEDGGIGVCVDAKSSFIDQQPISRTITREEFRRKVKGRHAVYHFGHQWYDVVLFECSDLNCSEFEVPSGTKMVSLAEYIGSQSRKPTPPELANLDPSGAVLMYRNNRNEERAAPAALCYLTHDTESREVRDSHRQTIMSPDARRTKVLSVVRRYFSDVRIGEGQLRLRDQPMAIKRRLFPIPDLEFGNGKRLTVNGTDGAKKAAVSNFGQSRRDMLTAAGAGFFVQSRLDRQYLILPKSVADSWGSQFAKDLGEVVKRLYPHGGYKPEMVVYNDVGVGRTFRDQANAILEAAQQSCVLPGFAAVMIHEVQKGKRAHDQLEAAILREFPKLSPSIRSSVLHSTTGSESYEPFTDASGDPAYRMRQNSRSRFVGYLRNVALSKVLLTNEKWPFVLVEPLHADVTVGIDVKHHTVGYSVVSRAGRSIRFHSDASQQSEKLLSSQIASQLEGILRAEFEDHGKSIRSVVIHRDGRAFSEECAGAEKAVAMLRAEGVLTADATLTIVEISKTGPSTFRFFELKGEPAKPQRVMNPRVGLHYITGNDAYLATTGWPFARPGTSNPLHVHYVSGGLPFEKCLEDVYRLSVLAWGRPEDCSRVPITIRLTDRVLGEDAAEYDQDALKFGVAPEKVSA